MDRLKKLIKASKDFLEYQSIGNRAKLNCEIEACEAFINLSDCERQPVTDNKQTQEQKFYPCAVELLSEGTETCVDECLDPENCKFLRADATYR